MTRSYDTKKVFEEGRNDPIREEQAAHALRGIPLKYRHKSNNSLCLCKQCKNYKICKELGE